MRILAAQKVDFIKIWVEGGGGNTPKTTPEIRAAIIDEAAKFKIPIVTHVTAIADLPPAPRLRLPTPPNRRRLRSDKRRMKSWRPWDSQSKRPELEPRRSIFTKI